MDYIFILGNHPELSIAEIFAYFGQKYEYKLLTKDILQLSGAAIDPLCLYYLGGSIKLAEVVKTFPVKQVAETSAAVSVDLATKFEGKLFFGISNYGCGHLPTKQIAMAIKRELVEAGRSVRWVVSREAVLSSVVVEQNKLLRAGFELIFVPLAGKEALIARTIAVQPFKELSKRDYGRPARDDASGMLPPKLAQIMLNLASVRAGDSVWDPFCGSGTVLTEAALVEVARAYGSDISDKAIADTAENIKWVESHFKIITKFDLAVSDAKNSKTLWPGEQFSAIVFEGFLGPQRGAVDWQHALKELSFLYNQVLPILRERLPVGGRLVAALPYIPRMKKGVTLETAGWKVPQLYPDNLAFLKDRSGEWPIYGREGQRVWRQLFVLEK